MSSVEITKVEMPQLDLGDGRLSSCSSYSSFSEPVSELSSPNSAYSQTSEEPEDWEEDIADVKAEFSDLSVFINPVKPDAGCGTSRSRSSSTHSSPLRDLPPHMDLPTLFETEDVRPCDSFLNMDDDDEEMDDFDELISVASVASDQLDLADALEHSRRLPSFDPLSDDEDEYGERSFEEIDQDRRIYLGENWVDLMIALEAGIPLMKQDEEENDFEDDFGMQYPTTTATPSAGELMFPQSQIQVA